VSRNPAVLIFSAFALVILAGVSAAKAGEIGFSGQVASPTPASAPLAGSITSFTEFAAVQLALPIQDMVKGAAVLKVRDLNGKSLPRRITRGGRAGQAVVVFKLSNKPVQDVTLCIERNETEKADASSACFRFRVRRFVMS